MTLEKYQEKKFSLPINDINSINSAIDVHYFGEFPKLLIEDWRKEIKDDKNLLEIYKGVFKPKTRQIFLDALNKTFDKFISSEYTESITKQTIKDYLKNSNLLDTLRYLYEETILRPNNSFVILPIDGEIKILNELVVNVDGVKYFESDDIYYRIDKDCFEIGKKTDGKVNWVKYNLNYNPVLSPIGIQSRNTSKSKKYLSSIFEPLLILLDEAIVAYLDARIGFNRSNYFSEIQKEIDCTADGCDDGICTDNDGENYDCHVCKGQGKIEIRSISSKTIVPYNDSNVGKDLGVGEYVGFVEPPLNSVKFARDTFDSLVDKINNDYFAPVNKNVGESEEALSIRLQNIKSWYSYIGDVFFSRYSDYLKCISFILEGDNYTRVDAPSDYDIETIESKIHNFGEFKKQSPFFAKEYFSHEILSKNYTNDQVTQRKIEVLEQFDILFYLDETLINTRKGQQAYTLDQLKKHDLGTHIIDIVSKDKNFLDVDINDLINRCNQEFAKINTNVLI